MRSQCPRRVLLQREGILPDVHRAPRCRDRRAPGGCRAAPTPVQAVGPQPAVRPEWAELPRRVFLFDVLGCSCGGRRKVIATIREGPVARRILEHLGLPAPARSDPQADLWPTGPPPEDAPPLDFAQRVPEFDVGQ